MQNAMSADIGTLVAGAAGERVDLADPDQLVAALQLRPVPQPPRGVGCVEMPVAFPVGATATTALGCRLVGAAELDAVLMLANPLRAGESSASLPMTSL